MTISNEQKVAQKERTFSLWVYLLSSRIKEVPAAPESSGKNGQMSILGAISGEGEWSHPWGWKYWCWNHNQDVLTKNMNCRMHMAVSLSLRCTLSREGIRNSDIRSDQIRSVAQSCPTLCDPMNLSTPGLPVHHQLPEFTQTHVHWVSDAIQPSHPLSSPSPPALNPSQHQSLFQWV